MPRPTTTTTPLQAVLADDERDLDTDGLSELLAAETPLRADESPSSDQPTDRPSDRPAGRQDRRTPLIVTLFAETPPQNRFVHSTARLQSNYVDARHNKQGKAIYTVCDCVRLCTCLYNSSTQPAVSLASHCQCCMLQTASD